MTTLFWKLFIGFWCTQVLTGILVAGVAWIDHRSPPAGSKSGWAAPFRRPPPITPHFKPAQDFPPTGWHPPPPPGSGLKFLNMPLLPVAVGALVSLIFSVLLAWVWSRPVRQLRGVIRRISNGELSARVPSPLRRRRDELGELARDLNVMAAEIDELIATKKHLLHDVSHELRSPLARIQAASSLMDQQPERRAEFGERLTREIQSMDALIDELLMLARIDVAEHVDDLARTNVTALLQSVREDAELEAHPKSIRIHLHVDAHTELVASPRLLQRAFENVLRNAIRYSPSHGHINVKLQRQAHELCISVSDQGPGVDATLLPHIFEPFVRNEQSERPMGHGLGLAIVLRIVQAHHGQVEAHNQLDGGLTVTMRLPLPHAMPN